MIGDLQLAELIALEDLLRRWVAYAERKGNLDSAIQARDLIGEVAGDAKRVLRENAQYERLRGGS